jgi:RNA polymerase sigma-70 factor (ECF subfamily)
MLPRTLSPSRPLADPPAGDGGLERLLEGIGRGEEAALAAFYDATSRWVFGLARKVLRDPSLAEEVTIDVYLQVWRSARSYCRERGSPTGWLLSIARSRAIDRLRAGAVLRRREGPSPERLETAAGGADPLAAAVDEERRRRVERALASLPPEQGQAIALAYLQGLTHREIAARLEEPLGTVKTRIRLGLMKLREMLRPYEDLNG